MLNQKILFLDDHWIVARRELERRFHEADKSPANPVLSPTKEWEESRVYLFGSVIRVNGHYRMWYQTCSNYLQGKDKALVCVADSEDLVRWQKPPIGSQPFNGGNGNNIVLKCTGPLPLYSPSILFDPDGSYTARRYKMLFWDSQGGKRGGCAAFSPDGLKWRRFGRHPLFDEPNDVLVTVGGSRDGFVCFQTLLRKDPSQNCRRDNLRGRRRVIGRRLSRDFINWSGPEVLLEPDEIDRPDTQFYGMAVHKEGQAWIGLLWTYSAAGQTSDVRLAWSHDGRNWSRPDDRSPLIPLGEEGEFDSHLIYTASQPAVREGRIHILYSGFDGPHDSTTRNAAIGLANLREEGWCSLDTNGEAAGLTTKPLPFKSRGLSLNINVEKGYCIAEIIDVENGEPYPGYSFYDSIPILQTNSINTKLLWKKGPAPDIPAGEWALRLRLRHASVFAVKSSI